MNVRPIRGVRISIRNESKKLKAPAAWLTKKTRFILRRLGQRNVRVSILFVDDPAMTAFNKRYLRHNRTTDVIAFDASPLNRRKKRGTLMADLLISLPTAKRQAALYGNSYANEICLYICHGLLHLLGYRDKTAKDARRMEKKQAQILKAAEAAG